VSSSRHLSLLNDLNKKKGLRLLTYRFRLRALDFDWRDIHQVYLRSIVDRVHAYILVASLLRIVASQRQHYHLCLYIAVSKWGLRRRYRLFFVVDGGCINYMLLWSSPWKHARVQCRVLQQRLPALLLIIDCVGKVTD
jgi:hypothetical protein